MFTLTSVGSVYVRRGVEQSVVTVVGEEVGSAGETAGGKRGKSGIN